MNVELLRAAFDSAKVRDLQDIATIAALVVDMSEGEASASVLGEVLAQRLRQPVAHVQATLQSLEHYGVIRTWTITRTLADEAVYAVEFDVVALGLAEG